MQDTLKRHLIERFKVESSSLESIGFAEGVTVVEFKSGHLYAYPMTEAEVEAFTTAPSKGRYYGQHIKGKIAGEKLTTRCSRCGSEPEVIGESCGGCGAVNLRPLDTTHKERE